MTTEVAGELEVLLVSVESLFDGGNEPKGLRRHCSLFHL